MTKKEHKTCVVLTGELSEKVEKRAKELHLGKSIIIRIAVGEYFKKLEENK